MTTPKKAVGNGFSIPGSATKMPLNLDRSFNGDDIETTCVPSPMAQEQLDGLQGWNFQTPGYYLILTEMYLRPFQTSFLDIQTRLWLTFSSFSDFLCMIEAFEPIRKQIWQGFNKAHEIQFHHIQFYTSTAYDVPLDSLLNFTKTNISCYICNIVQCDWKPTQIN